MQRVHVPGRVHGTSGRDEGLRRDLAAEDPRRALRRAHAAEQVHLELLDVEQRDESVEGDLPGRDGRAHDCCVVRPFGLGPGQAWSSSPSRCTRMRFVDPEVPGGEPATITTMSPAVNRPIDRIALSTWRTIASVEVT